MPAGDAYPPSSATAPDGNAPRVALFATCVANAVRPQAAQAALKLLRTAGCAVVVPEQSCCGQPAFNAGYEDEARRIARALLAAMDGVDAVISPSASCVGMVRNHLPGLFAEGSGQRQQATALAWRVFELCEFLHQIDFLPAAQIPARNWRGRLVLWHDSCASLRETPGASEAALALLRQVEGLEVMLPDAETRQTCCGFGGLFSIRQPEVSTALAQRKLDAMLAVLPGGVDGAQDVVLSGPDMGCLMHLGAAAEAAGMKLRVMHVAEILAGEGAEP